jgi:hypothetical protein
MNHPSKNVSRVRIGVIGCGVRISGVVMRAIRAFMGDALTLATNLLSTGRVALTKQPKENRHVLHLLYAPTVSRGGVMQLSGGNVSGGKSVEVIEDLPPLHDIEVTLQLPVTSAKLVPQGGMVSIEKSVNRVTLRLPALSCHQMIELSGHC